MATVTAVTFIVAFAPVLCELAGTKEDPLTGDCSGDSESPQVVDVDKPSSTVTLKCKEDDAVTPPFNDSEFRVCTQEECSHPPLLSDYIKGATGKMVNSSKVAATVEIENLPQEPKTFYIRCGDAGPKVCYIRVNVAASKPVVGGNGQSGVPGDGSGSTDGVTPESPLSCSEPGGAITIKIPEIGSTAQFTCGSLTLYPLATDRVFAEDCRKAESLKDIVRSANANVYTLTAAKKPPKKKWCYLCASSDVTSKDPGEASDYCLVHVESSSRTQSSSAIALAAVLPCVLAMLRIA